MPYCAYSMFNTEWRSTDERLPLVWSGWGTNNLAGWEAGSSPAYCLLLQPQSEAEIAQFSLLSFLLWVSHTVWQMPTAWDMGGFSVGRVSPPNSTTTQKWILQWCHRSSLRLLFPSFKPANLEMYGKRWHVFGTMPQAAVARVKGGNSQWADARRKERRP